MKLVVAVRYLLIAGALIATSNCRSSNAGLSRFEPVSTDVAYPGLPAATATAATPLSASDRIVIRDGHFYTAGPSSTRVRFFGVSLALSANFPSEADGEALAQRLSALGVNIVRQAAPPMSKTENIWSSHASFAPRRWRESIMQSCRRETVLRSVPRTSRQTSLESA